MHTRKPPGVHYTPDLLAVDVIKSLTSDGPAVLRKQLRHGWPENEWIHRVYYTSILEICICKTRTELLSIRHMSPLVALNLKHDHCSPLSSSHHFSIAMNISGHYDEGLQMITYNYDIRGLRHKLRPRRSLLQSFALGIFVLVEFPFKW